MSYRSVADFLEELGHAGELVRVDAEVDPALEIAEITRRIAQTEGPALLFGKARNITPPVLTNLLGSDQRIRRALGGASPDDVAGRIDAMIDPAEPAVWIERLKSSPRTSLLDCVPPKVVRSGPCQQVVRLGDDVDLGELPALQSAPEETSPIISAAMLWTVDPDTDRPVGGCYDLAVLGPNRLAVCRSAEREAARLLGRYQELGRPMPVAIVLGGDPVLALAAAMASDVGATAGFLREKPIDVVRCRTVELDVPADAEFIFEGLVDPSEPTAEVGPVCTPIGRYSPPRSYPVMGITAVTSRANPIFPTTVVGPPPHELSRIHRAVARIRLPLLKLAIPELIDYDLPSFAAVRHWAVISIHKTHAGQARRVAHAAWGMHELMFAKVLVLVDDDVDVRDRDSVLAAIAGNVNPGRDIIFQQGPPDPLDPATPPDELGQKMAIDATSKLPGEHKGPWPAAAAMSDSIRRQVEDRWAEYGLGPTV